MKETTTILNAILKLFKHPVTQGFLIHYLNEVDELFTVYEEGNVFEVQCGLFTISFTWDMITVVNNTNNKVLDCINEPTSAQRILYYFMGE